MISSGHFAVNKEYLLKLSKEDARQYLWEMFNRGGRIGHDGYCYWMDKLNLR